MLSLLYVLVPALAVQLGGCEKSCDLKPYAKITVIARGVVPPGMVEDHVRELKESVRILIGNRPRLGEFPEDDIDLEIRRVARDADEQAAISTSVIMAMTVGGAVY